MLPGALALARRLYAHTRYVVHSAYFRERFVHRCVRFCAFAPLRSFYTPTTPTIISHLALTYLPLSLFYTPTTPTIISRRRGLSSGAGQGAQLRSAAAVGAGVARVVLEPVLYRMRAQQSAPPGRPPWASICVGDFVFFKNESYIAVTESPDHPMYWVGRVVRAMDEALEAQLLGEERRRAGVAEQRALHPRAARAAIPQVRSPNFFVVVRSICFDTLLPLLICCFLCVRLP